MVLLQAKVLIQFRVKFRLEKILCTFLSFTRYPFERHKMLRTETMVQQYYKKE